MRVFAAVVPADMMRSVIFLNTMLFAMPVDSRGCFGDKYVKENLTDYCYRLAMLRFYANGHTEISTTSQTQTAPGQELINSNRARSTAALSCFGGHRRPSFLFWHATFDMGLLGRGMLCVGWFVRHICT